MYHADRALTDRTKDELGLAAVADAVANKIIELQPADGLVIGLQSPWGMGKSSFLNFLREKLTVAPNTIVVPFSPWLVDDRNAMLHELFGELSASLLKKEAVHAQRWDVKEARNRRAAALRLRQFARLAATLKSLPAAPHLSWVKDLMNLPILREIGAVVGFIISSAAALKPADYTLRELRGDIARRLALLNRKVVVIIDDVDRLETAEVREVFRLIRAVADFPNTTYIVAFDREPIELDGSQRDDIARSYLDKIIQVPIFLPEPETVDLRRMLAEALIGAGTAPGIIVRPLRTDSNPYQQDSEELRLSNALSPLVRTYLNSPRRIRIIQNALKTLWPGVSDDVDASDFLIFLCLQNFDRSLLAWVDDYLALRASRRWGTVTMEMSRNLRERLDLLLNASVKHRFDRLTLLRSLLPTMSSY
ncbi:P-loop NTPase fold protein [Brevundimonas vesicularis]|uniref:KAP family P-loop NTPase fold protein n=1 Tax=Brevundimonas vesicularis TaxID=41276 RepID=UPI0038D3CB06